MAKAVAQKTTTSKTEPKKGWSTWRLIFAAVAALILFAITKQIYTAIKQSSDASASKVISEELDKEVLSANTDLQNAQDSFDKIIQDVDSLGLEKAREAHKEDGKRARDEFTRAKNSFQHAEVLAGQLRERTSAEDWQEYFAQKTHYYATYEQLGETNLQLLNTVFDESIKDSKTFMAKCRDGVEKRNGLLKKAQDQLHDMKLPETPH